MRKKLISLFLIMAICLTGFINSATRVVAKSEDDLMNVVRSMPIEQKVAQMLMPSFRYWGTGDEQEAVTEINSEIEATIMKYSFGGVILFAQNTDEAAQTTALVNSMQNANLAGGAVSSLFISIDQEGGYITRLNTGTQMPGNMAIAATGDSNNAFLAANVMGNELAVQGINVDFAPVMDVNNNPANPVIGVRSFSDDPAVVSEYGEKFIEGLHKNGVLTALKHFPGHGDTDTDSHTGLPCIEKTYSELKELELVPFTNVANKTDFIMTAHIQYPNIEKQTYVSKSTGENIYLPATLSKTILTDILRNDIGFEGIIVTDAMNMAAISEHFDHIDAARLAINAGANMILMPVDLSSPEGLNELDEYISGIVNQINDGKISIDMVNDSVYRILKTKAKYGLLHDDSLNILKKSSRIQPSEALAVQTVGSKAHHDVEWNIALQSITSIKNDNVFPIAKNKKVVILYPYESQKNSIDYGIAKLTESGVVVDTNNITSVLMGSDATEESLMNAIDGADIVIGMSAIYSAEIKNADLMHSLILKTHEQGGKFIFLSTQLPYDLAEFPEADALLACYNAKGMTNIPDGTPNKKQYGPNVPAAIYSIFVGNNPSGTMPVKLQ